ncbi:MAG: hypothetical protein KKE17_09960 [Proteobacteria bacterium]|nr:hypothetical protein [Pseudomonadota bacterium]MBU1710317.1 hypothetical protein [Pseudomonadota bacterium]
MHISPLVLKSLLALSLITLSACATVPYKYGEDIESVNTLMLKENEKQIVRGRPVGFVDGLGHYFFSIPSKLILWSWKVENHDISTDTESAISKYLVDNDLNNVKIRINQYSPGSEWQRLFKNRDMPGFFRFTVGFVSTTLYTILPGRVFGGDHYNPYTNSISLYSDSPGIALHEAAHAKDFVKKPRGFKGWYALMRILPFFSLYQEAVATGDAIGYTREESLPDREKEAYKILYPAYLTYVSGEGLRFVSIDLWISYIAQFTLAIPGHIVGRIKAAHVEDQSSKISYLYNQPATPDDYLGNWYMGTWELHYDSVF